MMNVLIYKEQNRIQELERDKIEQDLKKEKNDLSSLKEKREDWRKKNQRLKQETGIVNDKFLKEDFDMRKDEISLLTKDIEQLKKHHEQLTQIIEKANMIELSKEMGN
jgi:DNA repair exonuclease SbcCD ATPase subunit